MRALSLILPAVALLGACSRGPDDGETREPGNATHAPAEVPAAVVAPSQNPLAARDPAPGAAIEPALADDKPRPLMQLQVVLDRLGFTPGVVDGKNGLSTTNAIRGVQEAQGLPVTGELDDGTRKALAGWSNIPATRVVTIPADFAAGPFLPIPAKAEDQAKMQSLGYRSLDEKLAERFHTTPAVLLELNAGTAATALPSAAASQDSATASHFGAGQQVRVPNVGNDLIEEGAVSDQGWLKTLDSLGIGSKQSPAAKIVVSKSKGTLKIYDAADKLIGMYTATMGSQHDPLPLGQWKVKGVAHNPHFAFDPKLLWDVPASESKQQLPPGPNGPVGVAWIDLSKPHYGIHGTPEPETIGRAQSHGCVRLTNWDVARLAQMVKAGTLVVFEP